MSFDIQAIRAALPVIPAESPFLIAVDGGSGSGKSTLGTELAAALGFELLSLDESFHIPVPDAVLDLRSPEDNFLEAFDRAAILARLKELRVALPAKRVVIEGVYSLRPEWAGLYDFSIWIELSPAARLLRMQVRQENTPSQMRLWQATEGWYIGAHKPQARASLVLRAEV